MLPPMNPSDIYLVYKQREKELEQAIQRRLIREAIEAAFRDNGRQRSAPWYAQAAQWLKAKTSFRTLQKQATATPIQLDEPCPVVPCQS